MRRTLRGGALESLSSFPDTHTHTRARERSAGLLFCLLAVCARAYTHRDRRFVSPGRPSAQVTDGFSSPPPPPNHNPTPPSTDGLFKVAKVHREKASPEQASEESWCLDGSLGATEHN